MNLSLILAAAWAIAANLLALLPSKRNHWPLAYVLIVFGVPILGYVTYQNGPWIGLLVWAAGISILRWPVYYLLRWVRKMFS